MINNRISNDYKKIQFFYVVYYKKNYLRLKLSFCGMPIALERKLNVTVLDALQNLGGFLFHYFKCEVELCGH